MYVVKVKVFKDWLHSQNSPCCTACSVADFLLKKFNDGRASYTSEGYRTAIADAYPEISLSRKEQPPSKLKIPRRQQLKGTTK